MPVKRTEKHNYLYSYKAMLNSEMLKADVLDPCEEGEEITFHVGFIFRGG